MDIVAPVLVALAVTAICAGIVRRVPAPLPVLQVIAGALLAWPLGLHVALEPDVFLLVFVAPLLFLDGWHIPKQEFARLRGTILLLAFGLVFITTLAVGLLLARCIPAMPAPVAFALAAALSPTDAVAVSGIASRTPFPKHMMHILQGEALLNDASGLVAMRVAVAAMLTGAFSWTSAGASFLVVATLGLVLGVCVAWLFGRLERLLLEETSEESGPSLLFTLIIPFTAYLVAEHVHVSGILAAAAAGMAVHRLELRTVRSYSSRLENRAVLRMIELALNGLVFVLFGMQLPGILRSAPIVAADAGIGTPSMLLGVAVVATLALVAVRFAWVWITLVAARWLDRRAGREVRPIRLRSVTAFALAGVRGAVTLAAALTLPLTMSDGSPFPARDVAIFVAAVAICVSLTIASVGLPLVMRGVVLPDDESDRIASELRVTLSKHALTVFDRTLAEEREKPEEKRSLHEPGLRLIRRAYEARAAGDERSESADLRLVDQARAWARIGVRAQREQLYELRRTRSVDDETFRRLLQELDTAESSLVAGASAARA